MTQKNDLLREAKAAVLKALAHPTRLWIVEQLHNKEHCVCTLVEQIDADFSTVSKHLSVLKNAGIIASEKRGQKVFYHLKCACVLEFISCIENVVSAQYDAHKALMS